jgi:hypothetical protein
MAGPRFQGYSLTPDGRGATLWFPTEAQQLEVEIQAPEQTAPQRLALKRQGAYWRTESPVPLGTRYRVYADNTPLPLDATTTVTTQGGQFNLVSPDASRIQPHHGLPMLHLFPHAAASQAQLKTYQQKLDALGQPHLDAAMRARHLYDVLPTPFTAMNTDPRGMFEAVDEAARLGYGKLLLNPLTGEMPRYFNSAHGYWAANPYSLNARFPDKKTLDQFLLHCLKRGMHLYFDAAIAGLGLNSVPFQSLLYDRVQSPFWRWFRWNSPLLPGHFPKEADGRHPLALGVLPTRLLPEGHREIDWDAFDVRVRNHPLDKNNYVPQAPTWVELYDPRLEPDGPGLRRPILHTGDSVVPYRFMVTAEEVRQKWPALMEQEKNYLQDLAGVQSLPADERRTRETELQAKFHQERKRLLLDWQQFGLCVPCQDALPKKWRGQVDLAQVDFSNPDAAKFMGGALTYWTGYVRNLYQDVLGRALTQQMRSQPNASPENWLKNVGHVAPVSRDNSLPVAFQTPHLDALRQSLRTPAPAAQQLAAHIVRDYPLAALPVPALLLRLLITPGVQEKLYTRGPLAQGAMFIQQQEPPVQAASDAAKTPGFLKMFPQTFEQQLAAKLALAMEQAPDLRESLSYAPIQKLVTEKIAESLFLTLLTGQANTNLHQATTDEVLRRIPQSLMRLNPLSAAQVLPMYLSQRLKELSPDTLRQWLQAQRLDELDPAAVVLAQNALDEKGLGVHWRLDAAKDLVPWPLLLYQTEGHHAGSVFKDEMQRVQRYWHDVVAPLRAMAPNTDVVAELTEFEKFSDDKAIADQVKRGLFESGVFDGMLNYDFSFARLKSLVHSATEPHKLAEPTTPSVFLEKLTQQARGLPAVASAATLNMTATHDSPTTAHDLLVHPGRFHQDHLSWRGLWDDFREVCHSLETKACFAQQRQALANAGIHDLHGTLETLKHQAETWIAEDLANHNKPDTPFFHFSQGVMNMFRQDIKRRPYTRYNTTINREIPTPTQLRPGFIDQLFIRNQAQVNLPEPQRSLLHDILRQQMQEPSEARAFRAVVNNALVQLTAGQRLATPDKTATPHVTALLYAALNDTLTPPPTAQDETVWTRHLGYQPLEVSLGHVMARVDRDQLKHLLGTDDAGAQRWIDTTHQALYETAMAPVFDKLRRVTALQQVLPGTPVTYYADLLGQTGGELENNRFNQNRSPFRRDWLPEAAGDTPGPAWLRHAANRQYYQQVQPLLRLRQRFPALKDGQLVAYEPDAALRQRLDEQGLLPIIRDNGQQQVIAVVNTGRPSVTGRDGAEAVNYWDLSGAWDAGKQPQANYPEVQVRQPVARLTSLEVTPARLPVGTRYRWHDEKDSPPALDASSQPVSAGGTVWVVARDAHSPRLWLVPEGRTQPGPDGKPQVQQAESAHGLGVPIATMGLFERL